MPRQKKRPQLSEEGFFVVAQRFRVLGEEVRLKLLMHLEKRECNVGELVTLTGHSQANVSKHLAILLAGGMVSRRKDGPKVFYSLGDPWVSELCDVMCHRLRRETAGRKSPFL